ncbi:RagB/SusD family nutrient uptake outer membrane protein [Maribacter sp. 2307ULW6-5]|uniref:RagB/SusD family nutrient uptake outer membrane protein n=1 Tax=Maribacter sp. 2307ULW6-5 TaxID=3386275 RepID=UPI0039BCDD85
MKTKNIYLFVFILFTMVSCEKFLEEDPRAVIAPETFFASDNDARQAIQGTYAILKNNSIYGQVGLDHFYDNGADIIEPNRSANFVQPIGNYTLDEALADVSVQKMSVSDTWKDLYRVVFNSNFIIERVTDNEAITEDVRTEVIAESRFLRALAYWHITNLWSDAPYYTEVLTLEEVGSLPRTDEATIISGVLEDLQFAQSILPSVYPADQNGRASKWAAAIIEAKIYMKQRNWQAGLTKCLEIINESPHVLLPTYAEVFDPANEYNAEIIWSLDFARDIEGIFDPAFPGRSFAGNNSWRPSMFNPRLRDEPANSDERSALADALSARGEAFNGTGLQVASKDFAEKFPLNDLRRELNIVDNYLGFDLNFPYMAKFWNLDLATSPRFNHEDNRMVFRLADVYLMAAECENELNGPAGAFQYLNPIRQRAYETQAEWDLTGLDQQGFREAIYDERKWELAAEAHRRYDLIRWGILLDVVQNLEYRFWEPNNNIRPWHVLLPIPLQELERNPNLLESDPTNNGYRQ